MISAIISFLFSGLDEINRLSALVVPVALRDFAGDKFCSSMIEAFLAVPWMERFGATTWSMRFI
jgi:hypothetical protein